MAPAELDTAGERMLRGGAFFGSVGGRREQHGAIFTDLLHETARKLPEHSHELPFFCLMLGGDYTERYGSGQSHCFRPFMASYRPAGVPHQDEIGPRGARLFGIEIKPEWQTSLAACAGTMDVARDSNGGALLWTAVKLYLETRGPAAVCDLSVESLIAELLGVVARIPREPLKHEPPWLRRVTDRIQAEFSRRMTLGDLSAEAGVHPVHLSRVFRSFTGTGVGEYANRLRIRSACERMLDREARLVDIGLDLGFADQPHFTRTFRKLTGMSPEAFRILVHGYDSRRGDRDRVSAAQPGEQA